MADNDDFGMFLIGFVVGGVAGAVAALLLAPQSGEETRTLIKDKSIELRDMATEQADIFTTRAGKVAEDARVRGKELVDLPARLPTKPGRTVKSWLIQPRRRFPRNPRSIYPASNLVLTSTQEFDWSWSTSCL